MEHERQNQNNEGSHPPGDLASKIESYLPLEPELAQLLKEGRYSEIEWRLGCRAQDGRVLELKEVWTPKMHPDWDSMAEILWTNPASFLARVRCRNMWMMKHGKNSLSGTSRRSRK